MDEELRGRMLAAAERLLDASVDRDISTRAVCEAVGVGQPVLYRLFGDKNGLLSAVVDHGFDRYLGLKRAAAPSPDPVADLRTGWDTHVAFALAHPAVYRLMYSPGFAAVPSAAAEALRILTEVLHRCAAAGRLRVDPPIAAQAVMSANIGVALSLVTQPGTYTDPDLSHRVRDAVHRTLLTDPDPDPVPGDAAAPGSGSGARPTAPVAAPARQLAALLLTEPSPLTAPETALLLQWLDAFTR